MKLIVVGKNNQRARTLSLGRWGQVLLSLCALGLPMVTWLGGYSMGADDSHVADRELLGQLRSELESQQGSVDEVRAQARREVQALTTRMAELQSRLIRLEALGSRITDMASLDEGEFNFEQPPAVGGPETSENLPLAPLNIDTTLDQLADQIDDRAQQLLVLETLLTNRRLEQESDVAGMPIRRGWLSSPFGKRNDPFTGHVAFHEGVDFAGAEGADIIAVASGVVTWSGYRSGYGQMVEVSHGAGLVTRYAHNRENLVQPGDVVKKGQTIALMGSSGRSTGPHVHFEVYKHGRPVDPASYIRRTHR